LYAHSDRVMSRQEIAQAVFQDQQTADDTSPQGRLSTLVLRLREEIEPHPDRPQYLITLRGQGYRLYPDGDGRD
jgi:DNA-binding response OmpR family regulator